MPAVGSAIAGIATAIGSLGAVGSALVNIGISAGLSYLARALAPKPAATSGGGFNGEIQAGGTVPRSFIFGRYATAGSLVYANTWGEIDKTPNAFLTMVIALSDIPVKGLVGIVVDGAPVTYDPNASQSANGGKGYAVPEYQKAGRNHLFIRFHDGNQNAADSLLVAQFASASRPWDSSRIGSGIAYAVVTALANDGMFSGIPALKFVVDGVRMYDIRNDSSVGGSGSERWDTPSTWSQAPRNPAVVLYNLLRGIRYAGQWVYGLQTVGGAQLPLSPWAAAANECDVTVTNADASTAKQYECGGEIQFSAEPGTELEAVLTACNGRLAEAGGIYKPHVGAAGAAVLSIRDGDILSTEEQTFTPFPSLDQAVNGVTATFISPADGWVETDLPPRYDAAYEAEDGGRRSLANVQYTRVASNQQGQRLMLSALQEARRARRHVVVLPPSAFLLEPLDFISFTSERNGYFDKLFRVDRIDDQANIDQVLYLTEVDPADYDYDADEDELPISEANLVIVRPPAQAIRDWAVEGVSIPADGGGSIAGLRLTWGWDSDNDTDIDEVQFEVRLASDQSIVRRGSTPFVSVGSLDITENIRPSTNYEARARFASISGRDFSWSDWLAATTPAGGSVSQADLDAALNAIIRRILAQLATDLPSLRADLDNVTGSIASQVSVLKENLGQVLNAVGVRYGENKALAEIAQSAAATANSALAAIFGDVFATTDSGEAESIFRFVASSAPAGVAASIVLQARATAQDDWSAAGLYIDAGVTELGGLSRIRLSANEIIFSDPQGVEAPFDALLLTVGDGITAVPIVSGTPNTVTPDLSDRREIYATLATNGFTLKFPTGARIGRSWKHEITQDATGGRSVAFGTGIINPAGGSVDTRANYTTLVDGYIRSLSPPIAVLTGFQAVAYGVQDWAYVGRYGVNDRGFRPVTDASGAADDLMVVFTMWTGQSSPFQIFPSNSLPAGWTQAHLRFGMYRNTDNNSNYVYHYAYITAAFRRLDGTETSKVNFLSSVSGLANGYRTEVYRFTGGLTPTVIQKKDDFKFGSNPSIILNLSAEQSRLIAFAAGVDFQNSGTAPTFPTFTASDRTDAAFTSPIGTRVGHKIYNSGPADETIAFQNKGDASCLIGFALKV